MNKSTLIFLYLTIFCSALSSASTESLPLIEQFPYYVEWDDLREFSYFPQGFYTFCEKAIKYPLITGPCSPCCALFVSDPKTKHTLGFHIGANNCLTSMTSIIDSHFPSQEGIKRNLDITLFTHAHTELHKHATFKEGTHKNRFLAIFNILNSKYHLVDYNLYFNDTDSDNFPQDRWIIYYGSNEEHKPKECRLSSWSKGGIDFERYNSIIYAEQFASIKAIDKFLEHAADEPFYKTSRHSLAHIKSLKKIHILPLKDGLVMQAFLPNNYHFKMPLGLKGLSDSWITSETSLHIASKLEKFIEENKNQLASEQTTKTVATLFQKEIVSYFTHTDDGWVLKTS